MNDELTPAEIIKDPAIAEVFNELPEAIQKAIVSSGWEQKIRAIAKRNNLVIGDAYTLERNTLLVMLGIISPRAYESTIQQEIELDEDRLNNIIASVDEEIFRTIKQELVDLENNEETAETEDDSSSVNITKEEVAAEMADHIEILPDENNEIGPVKSTTTPVAIQEESAPIPEVIPTETTPPAIIVADAVTVIPNKEQLPLSDEKSNTQKNVLTQATNTPRETSEEDFITSKLTSSAEASKQSVVSVMPASDERPKKLDPYREML